MSVSLAAVSPAPSTGPGPERRLTVVDGVNEPGPSLLPWGVRQGRALARSLHGTPGPAVTSASLLSPLPHLPLANGDASISQLYLEAQITDVKCGLKN